MALAASASHAFVQLLWWYLRKEPLALEKIDTAFSLNTSPARLRHLGLLRTLPILWFFGLLFPLISVATTFPPGALEVQMLPFIGNFPTMSVPTLDVNFRGKNTSIDLFANAYFMAGQDGAYHSDQYFVFAVSFMDEKSNALKNVSCVSMSATYDANITYVNGIQSVVVKQIRDEVPLNATALPRVSEFFDVWTKPGGDQIHLGESDFSLHSDAELNYRYSARQMQTLVDTLVLPLKSAISSFGTGESSFTGKTMIKDTPFAVPIYNATAMDYKGIYFSLSPSILQDLLANITISALNDADTATEGNTNVTATVYVKSYVFQSRLRLIAAYAAALLAFLPFILLGYAAMLQNGVEAIDGGFSQVLCTTVGSSEALKHLASRTCLGGHQSLPDELKKPKVRFGELHRPGEMKTAGFGTAEETAMLGKGQR